MAEARKRRSESLNKRQKVQKKSHSWGVIPSFFSCKYNQTAVAVIRRKKKQRKKIGCSVSLCNLKESSDIMQRTESNSLSSEGIHLRRLSGCYECHGVSWEASRRNSTKVSCPECEEMFTKSDSLELHRSLKHAELGAEETSRKIVEIIFQSSWLKRQTPICNIKRILKINNTNKTITRFEEYRNSIKTKANNNNLNKNSRCIADGNELLRFYCTNFNCSIGLNGSTNLCHSNSDDCEVCSIMREGLIKGDELGWIRTMGTSGTAHDMAKVVGREKERAMLVCRVIAGRVMRKSYEDFDKECCDSVAGVAGVYSNLDELFVFDSRAILPCFVVIYRCL